MRNNLCMSEKSSTFVRDFVVPESRNYRNPELQKTLKTKYYNERRREFE